MKILTGSFQSGKSSRVISEAARCLQNKETTLIITPSRLLNDRMMALLLEEIGAAVGSPALTLGELQNTLLDNNSILQTRPKTLGNFEQFCLLSSLILKLEPRLQAFSRVSQRPGLVKNLYRILRLLREEDIPHIPAEGPLRRRAEDLQLILSEYRSLLRERGLCDGPAAVDALAEALPKSAYAYPKNLFIDGFTDFTPSQFKFLTTFLRCASGAGANICITLTQADASPITAETLRLFQGAFPEAEILPLEAATPDLGSAFLGGKAPEKAPEIYEIQAFGRYKECEETANQIKKQLLFEGALPEDILVVASNHELYGPILESVFRKADIPLHFTRDDLLSRNPLVGFIKKCLVFMGGDITHEELHYFSKSNYLSSGLKTSFASAPLLVPQALQASAQIWREFLTRNAEDTERGFPSAQTAPLGEGLGLLERTLHSLDARRPYPVDTFIGALTAFLEACGVAESLGTGAEKDAAALRKLKDVFADLKKSLLLTEENSLTLAGFLFYFENIIQETRYRGGILRRGGVRVLGLEDARGIGARSVFFLGMNEGDFPPAPAGDLFDNGDRTLLNGEALRVFGRRIWETDSLYFQRAKFLFASALSLAKKSIFLCRTPADERGSYLAPSHFLTRTLSLAPFTRIPEYPSDKVRANNPEIYAMAPNFEKIYAPRFLPLPPENSNLPQIQAYQGEIALAIKAFEQGVLPPETRHFGGLGPSSAAAKRFQGREISISPTRLESYGRCPYRGLWEQSWNLRPLKIPKYNPEPKDTGTLYHSVLEDYIRQNPSGSFDRTLLRELLLTHMGAFPQKDVFLLDFNHLYSVLSVFLKKQQPALAQSQRPLHTELSTGEGGLPKNVVELGGLKLKVNAQIDRIDGALDGGGIHLIDYKTSGGAYNEYAKTAYGLFQGSFYGMLAEANALGSVASITYVLLETDEAVREYPKEQGRGKNKTLAFNSFGEYAQYKKTELLSLVSLLGSGSFLPYTLPMHLSQDFLQAYYAVYGGEPALEYSSKCGFCDYQSLCLRRQKLIKKF